mgnify:CR=1 FL=1
MKKNNYKKIFLLSLAFLILPILSYGQTFSEEIQDVNWNLSGDVFSVTGNGVMTTNTPTPTFRWQVEVGFAGNVTTNTDGSINVSGDVFGYVPADTSNLFTSVSPDLTSSGGNQFSFNMPSNFQNLLWPATKYYFDIVEWDAVGQNNSAVRDYVIIQTEPLQALNLNVNSASNGSTVLTLHVPSSINMYNSFGGVAIQGMPVDFYLLSEDRSGQQITPQNENLVVWAGSGVFNATGSITVTIPVGANLDPNEFYFLKLINGQPGAGEFPILMDDIGILLGDGNPVDPNDPGPTDPGFPDGGEEFSNGLVNCDGSAEDPCTFDKLLLLINRVLRFLIFVIGVPIVTLSFAYAGFLMVTSGGNPSKKEEAKSVIGNATIGLIVLLAAWLIIRTILIVFGYTGPLLGILGV